MQLTEDVKDYWNLRSEGFSKTIVEESQNNGAREAERLISDFGLGPGSEILDVGCGPGFFAMVLSDKGMRVTGIDYSEDMLDQARKNAESCGSDATFMKMDACDLGFPDSSFDLVICRDVLWNLERPADAYSEIFRVLRPGGRAIVRDGNFYLHLYDEDYREARKARRPAPEDREPRGHDKYRGDVDFNIIERIAEDLPLSKELRPAWDMSVLQDLPCSKVEVVYSPFRSESRDGRRLVMGFKIIITKEAIDV